MPFISVLLLYAFAEGKDLVPMLCKRFFVFDAGQAETAAAFDLKMPVKMLDAADDALAFLRIRAGAQCCGISLFAGRYRFVRLVRIAPRRAAAAAASTPACPPPITITSYTIMY